MVNKNIKSFITKCYNETKDAYCWYNTDKVLSNDELDDLINYFDAKEYNFIMILNGCSELRPQRTWGTFPTFLKGTNGCNLILSCTSNSFIICSWLEHYDDYENNINELLSSIPDEIEKIVYKKVIKLESVK